MKRFLGIGLLTVLLTGCSAAPVVCEAPPVQVHDDGLTITTALEHKRVVQAIHMAFFRMRWIALTTNTPKDMNYVVQGHDTKDRPILVKVTYENDGSYTIAFSGSDESIGGAGFFTQCLTLPDHAYFATQKQAE